MDWNDFKNKKVFLEAETTVGMRKYAGVIKDVMYLGEGSKGEKLYFIELIDKYQMVIGLASNTIKLIQEER